MIEHCFRTRKKRDEVTKCLGVKMKGLFCIFLRIQLDCLLDECHRMVKIFLSGCMLQIQKFVGEKIFKRDSLRRVVLKK